MKKYILFTLILLSVTNIIAETNNKPIVIISEIFYDTPLNERIAKGIPYSNGEFIELYNAGTVPADISGWKVTGSGSTEKYVFPATTIIPANGYIILGYQYNSTFYLPFGAILPSKRIVYQKKIILNNDGETVSLIDNTGGVRDRIFYNGTANLTQKDRLSATNEDGLDWDQCQSLHRINVVIDEDGKCISNNADWVTDCISPFSVKLSSSDINSGTFGGQNYVRTTIFIDKRKSTAASGSSTYRTRDDVKFYDGLGYLEETVQCDFAPDGRDLVSIQEYDLFKRPTKNWLPQIASNKGGGYINISDFSIQNQIIYADKYPYAEDVFDTNGRKLEHYGYGETWRENAANEELAYLVNDNIIRCFKFEITGHGISSSLKRTSYFENGKLSVVRTRNEDGVNAFEFKDVFGRTLLQRAQLKENGQTIDHDTYFVYDERDNLCYVLPPSIIHSNSYDYSDDAEMMKNYAYVYKYDSRDCCIGMRAPGADWTYMAYDNLKRLVLIQPGNLRTTNQWFRIHYDALGNMTDRELVTLTQPLSLQQIYDYVATIDDCSQWISLVDAKIQSRIYPEIYNYGKTDIPPGLAFQSSELFESAPAKFSCGLKNFELMPIYGSTLTAAGLKTVTRAYYYDIYDRLIQMVEINHLGGVNRKRIQYNYVGKPTRICEEIQPGAGSSLDVKCTEYTYDNAMRVTSEFTSMNSQDSVRVDYAYDDIGRLIWRKSGPIEENYDYNIRNWKTSQHNDWYDMTIAYDQPKLETSKPYYGGNISEISWRHLTPQDSLSTEQVYAFDFDDLSQLRDTKHLVDGAETTGFVETGLDYDFNGNITTLSRSKADSLSLFKYTYDGNKLMQVECLSSGMQVIIDDSVGNVYHYAYDLNGNMTHDGRRNVDVEYNLLNLPEKVSRDGIVLANYCYLSDGSKLSCWDSNGDGYEYLGSLIYERRNGDLHLESTSFNGGRFVAVQSNRSRLTPHYFVADHLGSTRVVIDSCGVVKERNDYYAFGKRWDDPDRPVSGNRYLFNGKEAQVIGITGWLDYGARMYDPEIGRWFVQDPMAQVDYSTSPYVYVRNNPIIFIDPNGKRIWPVNETYNGHLRRHEDNYGEQRSNGRTHGGVDINLGSGKDDLGAPVFATHDGIVTSVTKYDEGKNGGGNRVRITNSNGNVATFYMHLNSIDSGIGLNVPIREGQQIGTIGGTGYGKTDAYSPHLHYEMFLDGQRIDPTNGPNSLRDPMSFIAPALNIFIPEVVIREKSIYHRPRIEFPNTLLDNVQNDVDDIFESN